MSKFKVGDKVRVNYGWAFGTVGIIKRYAANGTFVMKANEKPNHAYCKDEGDNWCFHSADSLVELVVEQPRREFIVIRRSGAETIAELRHDREVIKSAKATCAPSDTFDLDTGAKLAFDRLMGRQNIDEAIKAWNEPSSAPEPPKFYTGKVFAAEELKMGYPSRIGRVFEFVDGNCINATSRDCILEPYASFKEICKELNYTKWIEVK